MVSRGWMFASCPGIRQPPMPDITPDIAEPCYIRLCPASPMKIEKMLREDSPVRIPYLIYRNIFRDFPGHVGHLGHGLTQ
jgi:hypothetical protein